MKAATATVDDRRSPATLGRDQLALVWYFILGFGLFRSVSGLLTCESIEEKKR